MRLSPPEPVRDWWRVPPVDRAVHLVGADPDVLAIALDPLPAGAPAVVHFRAPRPESLGELVGVLLNELDVLARALLPRWLPGAARLDGSATLAIPAARQMALGEAALQGAASAPFFADLAERALGGRGRSTRFADEVRAAGLIRVLAVAYARTRVAVLVDVPPGMTPAEEAALAGAAEWLAARGRCGVWLAGPPLVTVDRIAAVRLPAPLPSPKAPDDPPHDLPCGDPRPGDLPPGERLPGERLPGERLSAEAPPTGEVPMPMPMPVLVGPAVAGAPRADSPAEQALERALGACDWADGREWNGTYDVTALGRAYRLDLCWRAERVVVEVDGPDHRTAVKWYDDRARDVALVMDGFVVLRFPNEDVLADAQLAAARIHHVLSRRRAG